MVNAEKKAARDSKARAYKDLARSLANDAGAIYQPTASSIFDSLGKARLNERQAASSRLARETLFGEDPEASLPEELSDEAISVYLADAGDLYGSAATDYVLLSDVARAFKYFRKAAQLCADARHCTGTAEPASENGSKLAERAQEYKDRAALARHALARKSVLRRKLSLGLLTRLR